MARPNAVLAADAEVAPVPPFPIASVPVTEFVFAKGNAP